MEMSKIEADAPIPAPPVTLRSPLRERVEPSSSPRASDHETRGSTSTAHEWCGCYRAINRYPRRPNSFREKNL